MTVYNAVLFQAKGDATGPPKRSEGKSTATSTSTSSSTSSAKKERGGSAAKDDKSSDKKESKGESSLPRAPTAACSSSDVELGFISKNFWFFHGIFSFILAVPVDNKGLWSY